MAKKNPVSRGFLFTSAVTLSLTLGLAPFAPEPHIWEKIRWISTGQMPSESIYWLDLLMHGAPWVLLVAAIGAKIALRRAPTA